MSTTIKVLHDFNFDFTPEQLEFFKRIGVNVREDVPEPIEPGTIIENAEVDEEGVAHYIHPVADEFWYSRPGDYELVDAG